MHKKKGKTMIKVKEDLTGMIFGRLTVIEQTDDFVSKNGGRTAAWNVSCSCDGHVFKVRGSDLKSGHTKSCGCYARENSLKIINEVNSLGLNKKFTPNIYNLTGEYGIGYTTKGEEFYFDLEDYDLIKDYHWCIDKNGYVKSNDIRMHRLVMNEKNPKVVIDHIQHNKNDNRKKNLRKCISKENTRNCNPGKNNKSGFVGVYFDKQRNKWAATIKVDRKTIYLGRYNDIEDAVSARVEAEIKYFGYYSSIFQYIDNLEE